MTWNWPVGASFYQAAVSSVILLIAVFLLRTVVVRMVLRLERLTPEVRRRWIVSSRNASIVILMAGLILVWAQELRTVAVSLVALAVALVIATKELILCVSGAVIRATTKAYSIGDRVEIAGMRGDVVDHDVFTATLLEIGPGHTSHQYTGRAIIVPHSLLLNNPLINETYTEEYGLHVFTVPLSYKDNWQRAEQILLEAANAECQPFLEETRKYMKRLENRHGLESPTVVPRVTLEVPEPGQINLLLRIPTPARRKGRLEQAILRRFLSVYRREVSRSRVS